MNEIPPPRRRRRRRRRPSPALVAPLPDDVLLEILHRLPPDSSCLPRLSLVCKHWRRLVTDRRFHHRFHSPDRSPPVLGFFHNCFSLPCFVPTGKPPDRVPAEDFSLRRHPGRWIFLGCRHGRVLLASPFAAWRLLMVWDPLAGHRHDVPVPPTFHQLYFRSATLLCDAGECHRRPTPFRVVFAFVDHDGRPSTCVYSSQSGAWGELVSAEGEIPADMLLQPRNVVENNSAEMISAIDMKPPVLVNNILYWLLRSNYILEFNLDTNSLAVIDGPDRMYFLTNSWSAQIMPAEGGRKLGFASVRRLYLHLWARQVASDGTARWEMGRIVELDMFLPLEVRLRSTARFGLLGFSEDGSVAFLQSTIGVFMVQLDIMKFKMVLPRGMLHLVYPYSSFFLTDGCINNDQ